MTKQTNKIKERGILFTGPMAIKASDGSKTNTRRIITLPQAEHAHSAYPTDDGGWCFWSGAIPSSDVEREYMRRSAARKDDGFHCPLGDPGDRLWVREAWRAGHHWDDRKGAPPEPRAFGKQPAPNTAIHYEADGPAPGTFGRYRHARYMPRWASRTTLEIVSVRPERVQSISEADIAAEGVTQDVVRALWDGATKKRRSDAWRGDCPPRIDTFMPFALWHMGWALINGEDSYRRDPWVWRIEFRSVP